MPRRDERPVRAARPPQLAAPLRESGGYAFFGEKIKKNRKFLHNQNQKIANRKIEGRKIQLKFFLSYLRFATRTVDSPKSVSALPRRDSTKRSSS